MGNLAINGGQKVRSTLFPPYQVFDEHEERAVKRVLDSGVLSRFLGTWHEDFFGGPQVRALETEWAQYFGVAHAIAVNSATSGLYCAVGAAGIGPGDEVIVSPYTMSASATAALIYNAIPVFADVEPDFFCLDPKDVEKKITPRTKAIIVVDLFGQPFARDEINALAKAHDLVVIEDCAQAPGARMGDRFAGTLADMGVFSLNYHKHIHSGEGGIIVTDNADFADRLRLIRNHAESVVEGKGVANLVNMLGFNYRMCEIEAAICREQLKKLSDLVEQRIENVRYLSERLATIPCLEMAGTRENATHVYYVHAMKYHAHVAGIHRDCFVEAVKAELMPIERRETEGVKVGAGYVRPLYWQPMYQQRMAYGKQGCPFSCEKYDGTVSYERGICPTVEDLHQNTLMTHELMRPGMSRADLEDVYNAFHKVWENREELMV